MKNITISTDLRRAADRTWNEISPDAGFCSVLEAAELVLDRLTGPASDEVDKLIAEHGYQSVLTAFARIL